MKIKETNNIHIRTSKIMKHIYTYLLLSLSFTLYGQHVSVKESMMRLPTYPFSDPNPIAKPENLYYPYFRFEGYSKQSVQKEWKTVEMENDHIKLTVFPEIGGKIWGATEKSTGKEFIYFNHSVKFRNIAMRGAWTSGGIEFNFGIIGHAPTSSTPVDYLIRNNEDGSVSCFISATEYITRTTWSVEINLPKDKAYFTTRTIWSNTSQLEQPYYQWMNAGYKASGNLEFCYPGQYYIGHGGDVHSFPIDEQGRNISWYEKNNFGADKSYHVAGKYNDYYGAYWHDDNFGSVHHAAYDEKLGMKIFLWGLSREGKIWEDLLTDSDGQYVELQSGRMFNQPSNASAYTPYKHSSFMPGATDHWTEYWFPVKETGGISKVSSLGSLHVERNGDNLEIAFCPLQKLNTQISVMANNKVLFIDSLHLSTMNTWKKNIPVKTSDTPITIEIGEKDLVWNENSASDNLSRPTVHPTDFDWNTSYGLYVSSEQFMNQKQYLKAEKALLDCLKKDSYYLPGLNKLASLYYQTSRYEEALSLIRTSLSLNTYDGEANYLYGLINLKLNKLVDAKDGFSISSYSFAYRSIAYAMLAKCFLLEKDWKKAEHYASLALDINKLNQDAIQVLLVTYRYSGKREEALRVINEILTILPLNHPVRFEKTLLLNQSDDLSDFTSLVRNEFPEETYMEIANWYSSAGLIEESMQLLSLAKKNPIALYQIAYLYDQTDNADKSAQSLEEANALSNKLIFPFRPESLRSLEWAMMKTSSWKAKYYTAILYWHLGNKMKALNLLNECNDSPEASLYLSRSALKNEKEKLSDILKAEQIDASWRVGMELINYYFNAGEDILALQTGEKYTKKYPDNYMLGLKYAKALRLNGENDKCIALLKKLNVLPNEGAYEGRAIYKEACLYQAINFLSKKKYKNAIRSVEESKVWIENLGVGKPYEENIDTRLEDFILALIYEKLNDSTTAKSYYQKVIGQRKQQKFNSNDLLTALSLRQTGYRTEADNLAKNWLSDQPNSKIALWCTTVYNGEIVNISNFISDKYAPNESTPWESIKTDYNVTIISDLFQSIK
ncbi:DUF5107 domain-containing protein [Parabacteroides sp.]